MTEHVTHGDILNRITEVERRLFDGDNRFASNGHDIAEALSRLEPRVQPRTFGWSSSRQFPRPSRRGLFRC